MIGNIKKLVKILRYGDSRPSGVFVAFYSVVLGIWLLLPMQTFQVSSVYGAFKQMGIAEPFLGAALLVVGLVEWWALAIEQVEVRRIVALVLTVAWSFIAGSTWWAEPASLIPWMTTGLAIVSLWMFVRLSEIVHLGMSDRSCHLSETIYTERKK